MNRQLRHPFFALLLVAVFTGPGGAMALAQEDPPSNYSTTVEVERTNVEARVVDQEGRPVHGLTAADFQVFQDGEPVEVANFTEFRDGAPVGGGPIMKAGRPTTADHHLIVYFDDLHLQARHREVLIDALEAFVEERRIPAEQIMILRQGDELNIESPFGSSEKDLAKALRSLETAPAGISTEAAIQQALDEIQRTWNQSRDATSTGERGPLSIPGSEIPGSARPGSSGTSPRDVTGSSGALGGGLVPRSCNIFDSRVDAILSSWMQQRSQLIAVTLASLSDSVTYLAGLPGSKSLLYLSDALETMPGVALSDYADTICPGGQKDLAMQKLGQQLESSFVALSRHAAANRVTVYALQGGGLQVANVGGARDSGSRSGSLASFDASRRASNESGLIKLAEETGGQAAVNNRDYSQALQDLSTDMLNFYSLAYQPPSRGVGTDHEIEVRMRDPALQVRHRRGYVEKGAEQRFTEQLQGALFLGLVDNPMQARLAADDFRATSDGQMVLPLRVVLPVALVSFIPEGDQLMGNVLIKILSRDLTTGASAIAERPFKIKHQPTGGGEWMQLPVELQLAPGSHVLAIGVLDQISGMTSLVSTTLDVPSS